MPESKKPKRDSHLELVLGAIPDGRSIALSFARQIALRDERFEHILRDYDADNTLDLGDLCEAHKVAPAEFMAEVNKEAFPFVSEALNLAHTISTSIVAKKLPRVVERGMIEGAKKDGIADRHQILMKEGFHVAPKGPTINMNQVNMGGNVPSFEDETRELSSILQPEVLGPAGEHEFIEVYEEVEEEIPV